MNGEKKDTVTVIYCGNEMELFNKKHFPTRETAKKLFKILHLLRNEELWLIVC